jgi:predicted CoA-substrate-specific enzyme activase
MAITVAFPLAGIDCGAISTKAAIVAGGRILGTAAVPSGLDPFVSAQTALTAALFQSGLTQGELTRIAATGAGRAAVAFAERQVTEVTADARGSVFLNPAARTVLDIGAEEARAIRCDASGRALDFALNEKCAAGTGTFLESMARALRVSLDELSTLSLQSSRMVAMNAQCAVFAESEVVSLLHANTPLSSIAGAIFAAIASRAVALARRVGIAPTLVLAGGLALNPGFVAALRTALAEDGGIEPLNSPAFAGAIGAAMELAGCEPKGGPRVDH